MRGYGGADRSSVEFDGAAALAPMQAVRPGMRVLRLSAKTDEAMGEYLDLLAQARTASG